MPKEIVRQVLFKQGLKRTFVLKGQKKKHDEQCDLVIQRTFKNVTAEIKVQSEKSLETSDFNWENWIKAMKNFILESCAPLFTNSAKEQYLCMTQSRKTTTAVSGSPGMCSIAYILRILIALQSP